MDRSRTTVGTALDGALQATEKAWAASAMRRLLRATWPTVSVQERRRRIGVAMMMASAAALSARPFATSPQPYTWIVPLVAAAIALGLLIGGTRAD